MPISRDARMDRRRRLLRDNGEDESQPEGTTRRTSRKAQVDDEQESSGGKRKAGYSQDVRKACGQRLVQLIPVRRRSFAAVCLVSLLIPGLLLAMHYWIHVTGQLPWWRHPLAVALDVGHPRSIAAWLSSQLWLLCLGATVLTFQLRRHKLDDYNGEYRLWFWLVLTCLVASIDATTSITKLFAQALDRWTQTNIGWSGPAVVDSTLAVLIGMLGLRMCTELKAVPLSLVLWLGGLVCWAGSAALARPELQIEMSAPVRYWLISTLWLGGLTLIWLSALTYLRFIYFEAQQRFLLRGRLANSGTPLGQRLRESMPAMPNFRRGPRDAEVTGDSPSGLKTRWRLPGMPQFMRRGGGAPTNDELAEDTAPGRPAGRSRRAAKSSEVGPTASAVKPSAESHSNSPYPNTSSPTTSPPRPARPAPTAAESSAEEPQASASPRRGLGGFLRRPGLTQDSSSRQASATADQPKPGKLASATSAAKSEKTKKEGWGSWLRRGKDDDQADEYRKVGASDAAPISSRAQRAEAKAAQRAQAKETKEASRAAKSSRAANDAEQPNSGRRWLPKLARPTLPKLPRPRLPKVPKPKLGGLWSRMKVPSIGLSALRLQPPEDDDRPNSAAAPQSMRPVNEQRPLPGTEANYDDGFDDEDESDSDGDGRPLSKAERKRMRRLQQQNRRSA